MIRELPCFLRVVVGSSLLLNQKRPACIDKPSAIQAYKLCKSLESSISLSWTEHVFPTDQPGKQRM